MKKTLLLLLASAGASFGQFVAGFGYGGIELNPQPVLPDDISLGVLYGSLGYEITPTGNESFKLVPEIRVGTGVSGDTIIGVVDIEVEHVISASLRAEFHQQNAYFFLNPAFTSIKYKASALGVSLSDTVEEFGVGVGLGYHFTESASAELHLEFYDDVTVYGIGARFRF